METQRKRDHRGFAGVEKGSKGVRAQTVFPDTGTTIPALFPANFASLGINDSGHVSRVTLVDTTTANTDMRGTDGANTTAPDNAGIAAIKVTTDKLDDTLADNAGTFQFTVDALENAPSGGAASGGLTAGEAAQLQAIYNLTETSGGTETLNTSATELVATAMAQALADAHGAGSWEGAVDAAALAASVASQLALAAVRAQLGTGPVLTERIVVRATTWRVALPFELPADWTRVEFTARADASDSQSASLVHLVKSNPADAERMG